MLNYVNKEGGGQDQINASTVGCFASSNACHLPCTIENNSSRRFATMNRILKEDTILKTIILPTLT